MGRDYKRIWFDLLHDLCERTINMTDEEILAEAKEEGINIDEAVKEVDRIFESAKKEAARRLKAQENKR